MRIAARTRNLAAHSIAACVVAALFALPAPAGPMLSWTTDDGTLAFTDDPKAVPERYRDRVEVRKSAGLAEYQRYTPTDKSASEQYARGVQERLESMRRINAAADRYEAHRRGIAAAASDAPRISLRRQGSQGPAIDLSAARDGEPYVVEEIRYRPSGSAVTGPAVVVRQGDRTIAIVKERSRNTNVSSDILTDRDLLR